MLQQADVHTLEDELAELEESAPKVDPIRAWRTAQLGMMKQQSEYQALPLHLRNIVDYLVRHHEHKVDGAFPAQSTVARKFGVCRQTMNEYLKQIVAAKVLTKGPPTESRRRSRRGGRPTNTYRLNVALFTPRATEGDKTPDITPDKTGDIEAPTSHVEATQAEAPTGHKEATRGEAAAKVEEIAPRGGSLGGDVQAVRGSKADPLTSDTAIDENYGGKPITELSQSELAVLSRQQAEARERPRRRAPNR